MYAGNRPATNPANRPTSTLHPHLRHHIPHQPLHPAIDPHHHHRLRHPRMRRQHRLHLTRLDPEPPHLHLEISCAPHTPTPHSAAHRTRSPVRYIRAPTAPNGSATNRPAVNPARPQYPRATPAPRHIQLPHHPHRHRPQPRIQHHLAHPTHRGTHGDRTARHQRVTDVRHHRRLGRAVRVEHRPPRRPPRHQPRRARLPTHQRRAPTRRAPRDPPCPTPPASGTHG